MVKVSIIVPAYNAEKYLEKCLQSILNQTFKDIEIICMDDGSKDGTVEIMDKYEKMDERVKVIHKTNSGYGNSMNMALDIATGEYIGIVESDDWICEKMYEKLYNLTENGTVDVVKGNFADCYDEENGAITKVINQERKSIPDIKESFTLREYPQILWGHPSIWTGIYRREFLLENQIRFKEVKGGGWVDNPFFFDTLCCAKKIRWTKEPLYYYRKTNMESSSVGYDLKIPFERMTENLDVLNNRNYYDEEILKYAYARALMYLDGATREPHYSYNEEYAKPYIQKMLKRIIPDVITDDFNAWDQRLYYKHISPLVRLMPKTSKVLIYNWVPFDNWGKVGGGVTVYCKNLIESILRNRPDVQVYFLSSGWAYDISTTKCFFKRIPNIFGDRCRSFEIVNSPVPAPQDMLFYNPSIAFESSILKETFKDFIDKNGGFDVIHFNNLEGLSFDILSLKEEYPTTKFIYSMHNYVPICMTGFYYQRDKHCNCSPNHTVADCGSCINRNTDRNYMNEMIERARVNVFDSYKYDEKRWVQEFEFENLNIKKEADDLFEFAKKATQSINKYMDVVLAVSDRVKVIAEKNGIDSKLIKTSYIGTKIANYQIKKSAFERKDIFKIAYLGSALMYEEKGYPFLLDTLEQMDKKYASKVDLVLTTTTRDKDDYIKDKLKNYHSVKIIHGYKHADLPNILRGTNLGVVPALWEDNLPQIAIEMVSLGIPVLCSNSGGASELCSCDKFKFESGNKEDFLNKLIYFIEYADEVDEYWKYHKELVTLQKHVDEILDIYNIGDMPNVEMTAEEYKILLAENEFLYQHFSGEMNYEEIRQQRDMLQKELNRTKNSLTYKVGNSITWLPRKIRKIIRNRVV